MPYLALLAFVMVAASCDRGTGETLSSDTPPVTASVDSATPTPPAGDSADEGAATDGMVEAQPLGLPDRLQGTLTYEVVATYPHDEGSFTQGLEVLDEVLVESAGLRGESNRRLVDLETGEVLARQDLDATLFAEGITERDGLLYQLTWTSGTVLISDSSTLEATGETFSYAGEGWGVCTLAQEGEPFMMSNGSNLLTIRNPDTFAVLETLEVRDAQGRAVDLLNELECVGPQVLANVWTSPVIVAIDARTGDVDATLNLAALIPEGAEPGRDVLNGIAYRAETDTWLVTGKFWPILYELRLTSS